MNIFSVLLNIRSGSIEFRESINRFHSVTYARILLRSKYGYNHLLQQYRSFLLYLTWYSLAQNAIMISSKFTFSFIQYCTCWRNYAYETNECNDNGCRKQVRALQNSLLSMAKNRTNLAVQFRIGGSNSSEEAMQAQLIIIDESSSENRSKAYRHYVCTSATYKYCEGSNHIMCRYTVWIQHTVLNSYLL